MCDRSSWPAIFKVHREFDASGANQTEVNFVQDHGHHLDKMEAPRDTEEDDDDDDDHEDDALGGECIIPEGDILRTFLTDDMVPRGQIKTIMEFCEGAATLERLDKIPATEPNKWKGSIDFITKNGTLHSLGVLNAWEFYRELAIPVR